MPLELLIDGYNVIKQSPYLSQFDAVDLEEGRRALIERLAAYRRIRGHKISVVFDAWGSPHVYRQDRSHRGVTIIFTRHGETADEWIKRRLRDIGAGIVVTSDREIREYAHQMGIVTIISRDFERKMDEAILCEMKGIENDNGELMRPTKKGTAKRLSKKERKRRSITERL